MLSLIKKNEYLINFILKPILMYKMNQLFIGIVALVAFTYFGGSNVPNVLKNNKQILLGVLIGLVLGSFFGVSVEGLDCSATGTIISNKVLCTRINDMEAKVDKLRVDVDATGKKLDGAFNAILQNSIEIGHLKK